MLVAYQVLMELEFATKVNDHWSCGCVSVSGKLSMCNRMENCDALTKITGARAQEVDNYLIELELATMVIWLCEWGFERPF